MIENERIVLCRPCSGLNDTLNNIERCYRYCKKYNRKLFIDGSIGGFLDDFAHYFIPLDANISFEKIDFLQPPFDVFPYCLSNDLYNYELHWNKKTSSRTTEDGIPVTFDFEKDYKEQILVHAQGGSLKDLGIFALTRFVLKEEVKSHIQKAISGLKSQYGKYDAIHVRNTDYKTDYKSYFAEIKNKINKTTVICTDDYECQQYAKVFFGEKLKTVTDIPDLSAFESKTLHLNKDLDRYKINVDTLTDLFILACSERLFYAQILTGYYIKDYYVEQGATSGFLRLAKRLRNNKKIIKNMLYNKTNNGFTVSLALCECHFYFTLSKISQKFYRLFELLTNNGTQFTVKYIFEKLFRKYNPRKT